MSLSPSTDKQQNWILVDYENVQPPLDDLLRVLKCKCSNSRVMMFIGATQKKLPTDMTASLQEFGERVKYVQISSTRKNALDFHIAFYIGRLSAQHPDARFVIVSRDTGFDPLIQYCKAEKIHVVRKENVSGQTTQPKTPPPKTELTKTQGRVKAKKKNAKTAKERANVYVEGRLDLIKKTARPRKATTLAADIRAYFGVSEEEAEKVVDELKQDGRVNVDDNGHVRYPPKSAGGQRAAVGDGVKSQAVQAKATQPKAVPATPTEIKAETEKCRSLPF